MKLENTLGLSFVFTEAGTLARIEAGEICVSAAPASVLSRSVANVYLRRRGEPGGATALLGADCPSRILVGRASFEASGHWQGIDYVLRLTLAPGQLAWRWQALLTNRRTEAAELDLLYAQELGMKTKSSGLVNDYYVSQYLERRVLEDAERGSVVLCRQNMREQGGHPWLLVASAQRAASASTDGAQFFGRTFRGTGRPAALDASALGGELAGESPVVAIQEEPFWLAPGQTISRAFVASYVADHPEASSAQDLARLPALLDAFGASSQPCESRALRGAPPDDRLRRARLLQAEDLSEEELAVFFGETWRHAERRDGQLLSFFGDGSLHVVTRAKELSVDRPHGHIMQANGRYLPDERIVSSTAFACGVFNAHVTQGNTNFSTLLSVCTQPATPNLEGQRIIVQLEEGEYLLAVPSAFAMALNQCTWIYKFGERCLRVSAWTAQSAPYVHLDVEVVYGEPLGLAVTHQFDGLNGWSVAPQDAQTFVARPRADSMVAARFPAAQYRLIVHGQTPGVTATHVAAVGAESDTSVLAVPPTSRFTMSVVAEVAGPAATPQLADATAQRRADIAEANGAWAELSRSLALRGPPAIAPIDAILPWFGHNALIHYLTPYGLEQFSGAAWGTRDVSQGPIDLLLCQEKYDEARHVLRILFSHQNPDGGWPQWWMFDSFHAIRAHEAHGDIIYWTILALCSYVRTSGDFAFLQERLPFYGAAEVAPLCAHVERILTLVASSFVPGTALVQFGGGDWNDSLQPVSDDLARRMISSWTVEMSYQAVNEYRTLCEHAGDHPRAAQLAALGERIHADFHRHLVKDGVVAGYGLVDDDGKIDVLLHPRDTRTGVHYSLLPMNRGVISGAFSKQQAEEHLTLIAQNLQGPDGARLMDRPLAYHGGLQTIFQRAESSTYFGREIGLMYVHEHLRYAETLALMGRPDEFLRAMRQAIPVDYHAVVPQGDLRQANCYYSSSDVLFASRYEADERYAEAVAGKLPLRGGWRVYSSGPGIYVAHVVTRLLGLRVAFGQLIVDPVLSRSLDGLEASLRFRGRALTLRFRVEGAGFCPRALTLNGQSLEFTREENRYREGGALLELDRFVAALSAPSNVLDVLV